ncbi:beta-lactamase family protein [Fulvivirga maritima]|uniref:serine hydrolase domain-containing protein n=1 Tax=Fulvivirga maritima TaxID=2904247 RepID=UPI001F20EC0D|nr:serine hydrolase [Fulvivirga maritima]UII26129.1 beta-lactamase family protein [Fulvivirga maritima]
MRQIILAACLCSSICSFLQAQPAPNLPEIDLEEAGFNRDSLDNLYTSIENFENKDFRGLVVIKDNQIAVEWYFNTFWRNHIHDIRSAGKSITSLLLGVAMKDGLVKSLDQDVYSFFPKEKYPDMHEDYKKIKISHLLDMSSGLNADTDNADAPGSAGQWIGRDEWVQYILSIPTIEEPGVAWVYADINAAIIGAIIEEKAGMSLRDYAKEKVFDPLGIKEFYWYTNAANQTVAAGNLYLSTLDFAKLGMLVVNGGGWGEEQIIQQDYLKRLLTHKAFDLKDYWFLTDYYGMLWYKAERVYHGKKYEYLFASGNGGNHLVVVPKESIVIALTSSAYGQGYPHRRAYKILGKVLSALK